MSATTQQDVRFRTPIERDAASIWQLTHDEGELDLNSPYMYLLVCSDWAATSLIAEDDEGLVGFVAAYRPPPRPEAVFVWQIGVAARARRRGLGRALLHQTLQLPANADVKFVTATVTDDNEASTALFRRFADDLGADCVTTPRFGAELFPGGDHQPEVEFVIGPLVPDARA